MLIIYLLFIPLANLKQLSILENYGSIEKILSHFLVYWIQFFLSFLFSIYKMIDNKDSMGIYKSVKISIGTIIRNPVMLIFVLDHLKTKKMSKHAVKKLPFLT